MARRMIFVSGTKGIILVVILVFRK